MPSENSVVIRKNGKEISKQMDFKMIEENKSKINSL